MLGLAQVLKPWAKTAMVLFFALAAYLGAAMITIMLTGDAVLGAAVSAVIIALGFLGYRYWRTGNPLAPDAVPGEPVRSAHFWGWAVLGMILCWTTGQTLSRWAYTKWGDPAFDAGSAVQEQTPVVLLLFTVLILAPLGEEALMRGIAYGELRRRIPPVFAAIATSLMFAVLHQNMVQIVLTVPLGILLAFVYEQTGRLWPVVILHMAFNTASVFTPLDVVERAATLPFIITSALALVVVLCMLAPQDTDSEQQLQKTH